MLKEYHSAVALISVTDTEAERVMKMYDWQEIHLAGDDQQYYEAFFERNGVRHRVVTAQADEMGMTASAVLCTKLIASFKPRYMIMVGIAAGVVQPETGKQFFGDVAVANFVWNYASGRYVTPDKSQVSVGKIGFEARPSFIKMEDWLLPYIEKAINVPENETIVDIGPFASGSSVVDNAEFLDLIVRKTIKETIALDMEAYGVMYAASHAMEPKPTGIIIKSICDFADGKKNYYYQRFAAKTSCEFAQLLYEKFLPL